MNLKLNHADIYGIQLVLPLNQINFEDELDCYDFSYEQSIKLKSVMGYDKRRVVKSGVSSSDLIVAGFLEIFSNKKINADSIDALIVVTQSPDYLIPGTSYIVHDKLKLKSDLLCLDINQGCAGYIVGLITAMSLLSQDGIDRVALVNVDVLSSFVAVGDRNSRPIIGDAAAITIIDSSNSKDKISAIVKVDGSRWDALTIPAGGVKLRPSNETKVLESDSNGNVRSKENLVMKGDAVFSFVMQEVPLMIEGFLNESNYSVQDIDAFLFHQPNPFMLKKLAGKLKIPLDKIPYDLVSKYGNSSGVTIPAVLCDNFIVEDFIKEKVVCMAGFGVGLTWGAILMRMRNLKFLDTLEF